jgi:hypothetical protein
MELFCTERHHGHRNASLPMPTRNDAAAMLELPPTATHETHATDAACADPTSTLIGAGLGTVGGALAARYGWHPDFVSVGLLVGGGVLSKFAKTAKLRSGGFGAALTGGSQFLLMRMANVTAPAHPAATAQPAQPPATAVIAVTPPAAPPPAAPGRSADLGALPPGLLNAAFERARSELAVASDGGYPSGYEPHGM